MSVSKGLYILPFILLSASFSVAQKKNKAQLQKEKKENIEKIKEAEVILKETSSKKATSLGQLRALQYQISIRNKLIMDIQDEIGLLQKDIDENQQLIESLESDLAALKEEYGRMIYAAYKASNSRDRLTFLFSSDSFNQFIRRLDYMEQYSKARKSQAKQITLVELDLTGQNESILKKQNEKKELLNDQIKEKKSLAELKGKESQVLISLNQKESELKKELARRRKSLIALNKLIDDIIKKELEEARLAAEATTKASTALSSNFSKNRLKLPWPANGFISQKFGRSKDPVLKMVERDSPGIEIQTKSNAEAKAVFNGTVTAVAIIQGFNKAIIIKHGDFFTVYAKLKEVYVKKGSDISAGQTLGKIYTDKNGISELHFELWQSTSSSTKKLNPEQWLAKR